MSKLFAAAAIAVSVALPSRAMADAPCKLFARAEAAAYVGAPVSEGERALVPGVVGCSWADEASGNKMSVGVIPAGNALQLKFWGFEKWEGFRSVPGIGSKAYVARSPIMEVAGEKFGGEWQAGAIVGADYVSVALKGPNAAPEAALALLNEAIKRLR